jgi:hypothetical protein
VLAMSLMHVGSVLVLNVVGHWPVLILPLIIRVTSVIAALWIFRQFLQVRKVLVITRLLLLLGLIGLFLLYLSSSWVYRLVDVAMERELAQSGSIDGLQQWADSFFSNSQNKAMLDLDVQNGNGGAVQSAMPVQYRRFLSEFRDVQIFQDEAGLYYCSYSTGGWDYHWGVYIGPTGFVPVHPQTHTYACRGGIIFWHLSN